MDLPVEWRIIQFYFVALCLGLGLQSKYHGFLGGIAAGLNVIYTNISRINFANVHLGALFSPENDTQHLVAAIHEIAVSGATIAFILMNFAIIIENLVPIPNLDGGRLIVDTIEHISLQLNVPGKYVDYFKEGALRAGMLLVFLVWLIPDIRSVANHDHMNPWIYSLWLLLFMSTALYIQERRDGQNEKARPK